MTQVLASLSNGLKLMQVHFNGCNRGEMSLAEEELPLVRAVVEERSKAGVESGSSKLEYSVEFVPVEAPSIVIPKVQAAVVLNQHQQSVTQQLMQLISGIQNVKLLRGGDDPDWRLAREYSRQYPQDPYPLGNLSQIEARVQSGSYPGGVKALMSDLERCALQHGRRSPPGTPGWRASQEILMALDAASRDLHIGRVSDFRVNRISSSMAQCRTISELAWAEETRQNLIRQQQESQLQAEREKNLETAAAARRRPANPRPPGSKPASSRSVPMPLTDEELERLDEMYSCLSADQVTDVKVLFISCIDPSAPEDTLRFLPTTGLGEQRQVFDYVAHLFDETQGRKQGFATSGVGFAKVRKVAGTSNQKNKASKQQNSNISNSSHNFPHQNFMKNTQHRPVESRVAIDDFIPMVPVKSFDEIANSGSSFSSSSGFESDSQSSDETPNKMCLIHSLLR